MIGLASVGCFAISSNTVQAQIQFQDVSEQALDLISTESWGLSVGDYNGDGWQDIFVTNHRDRSSLHRNNGNGTFTDVMIYADKDGQFTQNRFADHHRGVFSDTDNDGDDDLVVLQLTRGNPSNTPNDWHRLPLFSDNGYLSLNGSRTSNNDGWSAEYNCTDGHPDWFFPMYGDLDNDGEAEYMCVETGKFEFITPGIYNGLDYAFEDFDNDLRQEIFAMIGGNVIDDAKQTSPTRAEAFLQYTSDVGASTMRFKADPPVTFTVHYKSSNETVTLLGGNQTVNTVNISYSLGDGYWTVRGINNDTAFWLRYKTAHVVADAPSGVSDVSISDQLATSAAMRPRVMKVENGDWRNRSWSAGFREDVLCSSVVTGDFDNDKDQDIYLTCREGVENTPNRLFENDGNGFFTEVSGAGGAEGLLGKGLDTYSGLAENTVVFDYDNDGFLDLMVTNGKSVQPIRRGGAPSLLRNLGNGNHWVQLDLRTDGPNYSAVGARVVATSGGVSQLRFQNAGLHRYSQNQQRIHFGLGQDSSVDLEIRWPDGQVESFANVTADRLYEVRQGDGMSVKTAAQNIAAFEQPSSSNGGACGTPPYLQDRDEDLFLFQQNCGSNDFNVVMTGGSDEATQYSGRLVTTGGTSISNWNPVYAESQDSISGNSTEIVFSTVTARNDRDGFNFRLNGNDACLYLDAPTKSEILVGGKALPVNGRGINPKTFQPCSAGSGATLISANPVDVNESAGTAMFTISLSQPATQPTSVIFATREGSATAPEDFYGKSTTVNFAVGESSKTVDIDLIDDNTVESTEFLTVRLFSPTNAIVDTPETTVTIQDDDTGGTAPSLSIASISAGEGSGSADLTVSLSAPVTQVVDVKVATVTGTATKGQDYYGMFQQLSFAPGETSKTVSVTVVDDTATENTETFGVRLFQASGAPISESPATVSIIDNDQTSTPDVSISSQSVNEGSGSFTGTVTLSSPSATPVEVKVSTTPGTASQGQDYYGTFKVLTFAAGETQKDVSITVINDANAEANETFNVRLFGATGANITNALTPITIIDDD